MKVVSNDIAETKQIAAKLAAKILKRRPGVRAFVVALSGELGAGKTTFVQGFMEATGITGKVKSPTFLLIKNYKLANSRFTDVYHIDCYRVESWRDLEPLDIKNILGNPHAIVLVEWPERISAILSKVLYKVKFEHVDPKTRKIDIS